MKIVGIDPGTTRVGYACIEGDRHAPRLLSAETIAIPASRDAALQLIRIEKALQERLKRDLPETVSVEQLFLTKNQKTAIRVAEARGIILLTARREARSIWEYTPLEVKLAVTGNGRADKSDVRRIIQLSFPNATLPGGDDAIDAIAIALTACVMPRNSE